MEKEKAEAQRQEASGLVWCPECSVSSAFYILFSLCVCVWVFVCKKGIWLHPSLLCAESAMWYRRCDMSAWEKEAQEAAVFMYACAHWWQQSQTCCITTPLVRALMLAQTSGNWSVTSTHDSLTKGDSASVSASPTANLTPSMHVPAKSNLPVRQHDSTHLHDCFNYFQNKFGPT